ncbi:MAG: hypothetical protein U0893_21070 [Chloroflexota bacterium]
MVYCLLQPRPLNDWERDMLARLLAVPFPGVEELRQQCPHLLVSEEYGEGDPTVIFIAAREQAPPVTVRYRVPVEGRAYEANGTPVEVLLHVVDGYLWELEYVRYDVAPPQPILGPEQFTISVATY